MKNKTIFMLKITARLLQIEVSLKPHACWFRKKKYPISLFLQKKKKI